MKHNKNTNINAKQIILIPKNDEYEYSINTETQRRKDCCIMGCM